MTAGPSRRRGLIALVAVVSVAVAAALAVAVTRQDGTSGPGPAASVAQEATATSIDAEGFLDAYVDADGRVVRHDQGGDTVSEGQAYGMLIALGADDRDAFERIWAWTSENLARDDGLLSWRWDDGSVVDPSSASDADLDAARALVRAGRHWDSRALLREGRALGTAVLDHETVETSDGLVLVAGQWATDSAPHAFNPSYVSPAATSVMSDATDDPRWDALEKGSRAAVEDLTGEGSLPPDWAQVQDDGSVDPVQGPAGQPVQFGYDAARTVLRHAESCTASDRGVAERAATLMARDGDVAARYDLGGAPQTQDRSPLTLVAQASGLAAAGEDREALAAIREADDAQRDAPTYYGDAWTVLGPMLLTDPVLGGCPVWEDR